LHLNPEARPVTDQINDINGRPAVRLHEARVEKIIGSMASIVHWQGEKFWVPNSQLRDNKDKTADVTQWFYDKKINNSETSP